MAAVVTGAAGFIGRALVSRLLDTGTHVIGIDREPYEPSQRSRASLTELSSFASPPARCGSSSRASLTVLKADLLDDDEMVRTALETADVVFHLAACPGVRDDRPDVEMHRHRDNVLATAAVLAAVPYRTLVVVTSSSSVYGGSTDGRPCAETDRLRPQGGYARSKVRVERLCEERLGAGGTVTIARPFTVVGEGQRPDMALAQWIVAARDGRPLRVLGSLDRTRDLTDVRDAAYALVALAERGVRGVVNVGTGAGQTLRAMVAAVAETLDVDVETVHVPAAAREVPATLADITRLRQSTGFVPVTDLRDVVARQVACASAPASIVTSPASSSAAADG